MIDLADFMTFPVKMDKQAEEERRRKLEEQRISREEEMRELALKLRRKEREKRHAENLGLGSDSDQSEPSAKEENGSSRERYDFVAAMTCSTRSFSNKFYVVGDARQARNVSRGGGIAQDLPHATGEEGDGPGLAVAAESKTQSVRGKKTYLSTLSLQSLSPPQQTLSFT